MTVAPLLIRADAAVAMGTGHVMRCLALAQAWQDAGGHAAFAMADSTPAIEARLTAELCRIVPVSSPAGSIDDASQTIGIARDCRADWLVVDGYRFGADYQRALKEAGFKVLFVDDYGHAERYSANIILDQNANAPEKLYSQRGRDSRLLLGAKYVLLRHEFQSWLEWTRPIGASGNKILISMGGSDPDNLTERALEAVNHCGIEGLSITVVIGGSNPHESLLERALERSKNPIRLLRDARQMPELLADADIAMISAGGTLWEALFMQCAVLSYGRDLVQKAVVDTLAGEEVVVSLSTGTQSGRGSESQILRQVVSSPAWRQKLSRKGRNLVDGRGVQRVVGILLGREDLQ